ncbi:MAG: GNAT family N-acetyltransferase [Lachnospiraceae bacterium]|nr:GNAT family N-acetyltransferase [Lachnospiraceae bacterium]MDY4971220.1 GNAT family N-acetyltransferase [Lachnospiraceae bacterium]
MELIRAEQTWQQAGNHYVRVEAMVKGFQIPLRMEFDEYDTPESRYIVAVDSVLPVGTCRLRQLDENTAKIERVCVLEEYRGKGVGRQVITAAEEWLRENGVQKIIITSREEAVGFYEKLGYTADWSKKEGSGRFVCVYTEKLLYV